MDKPQVNIVESQSETITPVNVSRSEEIALLAKYGYQPSHYVDTPHNINTELSFEEMVRLQEEKNINSYNHQNKKRPQVFSIDSRNIAYQDSAYRTLDDENNFGIEIQIVSDMKIPRY